MGANRLIFYFILGILFSLSLDIRQSHAVWSSGGPNGGYIHSLATTPVNPDIIFAGTEGGVFKTTDGGASWEKTGFPDTGCLVPKGAWRQRGAQVVSVSPQNADIVFAGTAAGLYKSSDGGHSWTLKGLSGARVNTIVINADNPNILYAGTGTIDFDDADDIVGVFKSTDGGESWQHKRSFDEDAVMSLLIDTQDASIIYAGCFWSFGGDCGVYRSEDAGETWSQTPDADNWQVVALAMTPAGATPATIYALGTGPGPINRRVYKSTDRCNTWTLTNSPSIHYNPPHALAVDPNNHAVVYVGGRWNALVQLHKSSDGGDTWSEKVNGLSPKGGLATVLIDPRGNGVIYAGLFSGGVYKSVDNAELWRLLNLKNTYMVDLAVHPISSNTVFAAVQGNGHYMAKTTNTGRSWEPLDIFYTNRGAITIDHQNPSTSYSGPGWKDRNNTCYGIYKSTDSWQSWTTLNYMVCVSGYHYAGISDIWVKPTDTDTLLVSIAGYPTDGGGVYKSTDAGNTWRQTAGSWATTIAADSTNPEILYYGKSQVGDVLRSTDCGSSWTNISPGPAGSWVNEVREIVVGSNSNVYAATEGGLWKWDGAVWAKLNGLPTDDTAALTIDRSASPETIYVGTGGDGIFFSRDGATTWLSINEGWEYFCVRKLAVSTTAPKILYAGTAYGGVWSKRINDLPIVSSWLLLLLFGDR